MTYQVKKSRDTRDNTGLGTAKIVKEFLYHPDIIKNLKTGEAIYMSKDLNIHYQKEVDCSLSDTYSIARTCKSIRASIIVHK